MSSDNQQHSGDLDAVLKDSYAVYKQAMVRFHALLAEAVLDRPERAERLFERVMMEARLFRVLHLISVGYSGTPTFYRAVSSGDLMDASLRGLVDFDGISRTYVITEPGIIKFTWWREHIAPLRGHEPFATLWDVVTSV